LYLIRSMKNVNHKCSDMWKWAKMLLNTGTIYKIHSKTLRNLHLILQSVNILVIVLVLASITSDPILNFIIPGKSTDHFICEFGFVKCG